MTPDRDDLVAEVERLRLMVAEQCGWGCEWRRMAYRCVILHDQIAGREEGVVATLPAGIQAALRAEDQAEYEALRTAILAYDLLAAQRAFMARESMRELRELEEQKEAP